MFKKNILSVLKRLRSCDLERSRAHERSTAAVTRCAELEAELKNSQQELERLTKVNEKAEAIKSAASRKDAMMKGLRAQLEKVLSLLQSCYFMLYF
jgi:septation ring formation regulator EzrA